jgi:hypothetical protein
MPEEGRDGYVSLRKGGFGVRRLALRTRLRKTAEAGGGVCGVHTPEGSEEAGEGVYEKAKEIIEEGKAWGSQTLEGFEKKVEVNGKTYVVKVKGGEAVEEKQNGKNSAED